MFKFITHRPLWVNLLTGIALAVVILFVFAFSLQWCTHHSESKTVPSVVGKSYEQAEEILSKAGFEVAIQDSVYTDTSKPLSVIKQVPEADELVKVNRKVYIVINRAVPPMVELPKVNGFSYRSAEMLLKNANLQLGEVTYKNYFAKDAVLDVLYNGRPIEPFTKIRMGSKISLVLGDGAGDQQIPVPTLVGRTYCEAREYLREHGIEFGSIIAPGITDTCKAFISRQVPERFDEERKIRMIRSGQLIDIWLTEDKPTVDSLPPTGPQPE